VSIGEVLAEARRQAGLTIPQVSQRTCIRETIIRGIEHDDYSACGGDFYARGHIRSIAGVVGADPEPLIREYDATQRAPQSITAAEVFQPVTPIRLRERRRLNWTAVLALALAALAGFGVYHYAFAPGRNAARSSPPPPSPHLSHNLAARGSPSPAPSTTPASHPYAHKVVISLTAKTDCWVGFYTPSGAYLSQSYLTAGTTERWVFRRAVNMRIGNPAGVTLTVNGKNKATGSTTQPITLSLGPGRHISS
jgi:cytoskeletal protein RodZ